MAAIYFILLAFEKGEMSMKSAWTALLFLGVSILGQFILKMAADLHRRTAAAAWCNLCFCGARGKVCLF